MLHSGIDMHKRTIAIATVTPDRQAVRDTELPTTRTAVRAYFDALPGPHRAVVESTSNWYWLRDHRGRKQRAKVVPYEPKDLLEFVAAFCRISRVHIEC